ncbi:MAG: bifunctional diaminohydroxyphosphoribosylaminopyrimidine deaminase/5-amino-6-(5-phosphoribosylamino)uracil reductase RibD [Candidatus Omnitrophica bacterium]|nr:bifunctional diaminohydroxyphosphoribosylaminopyrimidine deaminase/5-amino-6-(5-phosphoribosylamino)uracil reductase RibD [Candidatus Omnitrophota bacterium]
MKKNHEYFMRRAIELAVKAKGKTSPNPIVGAVVVKNGRIIAEGFHEQAGLAHAEVVALGKAGVKAKGSTLYVTLEPCVHYGRTPPCTDMILRSGFCEDELRQINESFIKYITKRIPFVTVKVAQSLDGKIATRTGDSKWITSDESRGYAHRIRSQFDAIMVGVNTVRKDDPRLDSWFSKKHPIKIIVDSQLSISQDANLFSGKSQVIIVTLNVRPGQETENRKLLGAKAKILEVKEKDGQINLNDMMKKLARMDITSILVEGGGTLVGSLFDDRLVDRVLFFVSPKIVGGKEAISSVMGRGIERMDKAVKLKKIKLRRFGEDMLVEAYV